MACDTPGEFYIDDQRIDMLEIDDQEIDFLEIDGTCVWARVIPARLILDEVGNYEWDLSAIPGLIKAQLCMVGAGGSGAAHGNYDGTGIGGGYAGDLYNNEVTFTSGEIVSMSVMCSPVPIKYTGVFVR